MNLVDEQNGVRLGLERIEHLLDAFFEITAVPCTCHQRPQVERINARLLERGRHAALVNPQRQTFSQRRLADAGFSDQQRIVLPSPTEHVHHAVELGVASNQRVNLPCGGTRRQIGGIGLERLRTTGCLSSIIRSHPCPAIRCLPA